MCVVLFKTTFAQHAAHADHKRERKACQEPQAAGGAFRQKVCGNNWQSDLNAWDRWQHHHRECHMQHGRRLPQDRQIVSTASLSKNTVQAPPPRPWVLCRLTRAFLHIHGFALCAPIQPQTSNGPFQQPNAWIEAKSAWAPSLWRGGGGDGGNGVGRGVHGQAGVGTPGNEEGGVGMPWIWNRGTNVKAPRPPQGCAVAVAMPLHSDLGCMPPPPQHPCLLYWLPWTMRVRWPCAHAARPASKSMSQPSIPMCYPQTSHSPPAQATSPPPSQGPVCGRNGYITPAFLGPQHRDKNCKTIEIEIQERNFLNSWLVMVVLEKRGTTGEIGENFARRSKGESLHCALLLDYVPPEEPPSTPLGNALRIR